MSSSLPLLPSSLKRSLLKVYLTWVSNNLVLKDQGKKLVDSMGCELGLHFDYTLPGMEKVERQSIIRLRDTGCFVKCEHNFSRINTTEN